MKKIIILLSCILIVTGCNSNKENTQKKEESIPKYQEIINEGNYIILDVRTKEEYQSSHIKDAINIPYDEIDDKVELDKTKTILVYCQSGKRSNIAYTTLKGLDYEVYDMGAYNSIKLEKE